MTQQFKRVVAEFYHSPSGNEPVRDWLKSLPLDDRKAIGKDIATVEYAWPVGMPLCRSLRNNIWEIRSNLEHGRISRVLFFNLRTRMVLLHGFIKKTQKTSPRDLQLAEQRMKEVLKHES
jgi:phage-related protein